jgi:hypothetical protein
MFHSFASLRWDPVAIARIGSWSLVDQNKVADDVGGTVVFLALPLKFTLAAAKHPWPWRDAAGLTREESSRHPNEAPLQVDGS